MNTNLSQDGVDQLALRQGKIKIMIAGEDVAEKQCHTNLCQGGHASTHDPHLSPRHTSSKVLPRNTQQLADEKVKFEWRWYLCEMKENAKKMKAKGHNGSLGLLQRVASISLLEALSFGKEMG